MGEDLQNSSALPVRTTRHRRAGRHSSPHQLSLPSDAPALVIAVPGSATPENRDITSRVAEQASVSCPGVSLYAGYLDGGEDSLSAILAGLAEAGAAHPAVIVPLQAFSDDDTDAAISECASNSPLPCLTAASLGPHPLLGEALHARLADAGLARATRVGRVNVVTGTDGVIVGATGSADSVQSAGIVAVLLASRLMAPVACEPLADIARIAKAAGDLRSTGVNRVVLAPCAVGPELPPGTLEEIAAQTGLEYADPLGAHPAIAKLVAIRYGAALVDPQLSDSVSGPGKRQRHAGNPAS